jgi:FkbM family methyltransferase
MTWVVPEGDTKTIPAIELEWKNKSKTIIDLCKDKNVVVQAGGNLGVFPAYLSKTFEKVITFEPIHKNYICLLENISGINNISVYNYGLGDKYSSTKILKEVPQNCGAIRLEYDNEGNIPIIPLDEVNFNTVDLIWLDVEGFEIKALRGAKNTIMKYKPILVAENNGITPEFPADLNGSKEFQNWIEQTFNYKFYTRIMRDDIYVPA